MNQPPTEPWQPWQPPAGDAPQPALAKVKITPTWHWIFPGLVAGIPILLLIGGATEIPPLLWVIIVGFALAVTLIVLIIRALIRVGDKHPSPVVIAPQRSGPQLPPAGWYPDAEGIIRWFDG
ncbi:hypothetical protein [Nocardia sp. NPDC019395]|uniref:hypothetical protein n=1 Tax=Nocardia sp. NPDC019395 TaxID=3154686 RepID=UPI0033DE8EBC